MKVRGSHVPREKWRSSSSPSLRAWWREGFNMTTLASSNYPHRLQAIGRNAIHSSSSLLFLEGVRRAFPVLLTWLYPRGQALFDCFLPLSLLAWLYADLALINVIGTHGGFSLFVSYSLQWGASCRQLTLDIGQILFCFTSHIPFFNKSWLALTLNYRVVIPTISREKDVRNRWWTADADADGLIESVWHEERKFSNCLSWFLSTWFD